MGTDSQNSTCFVFLGKGPGRGPLQAKSVGNGHFSSVSLMAHLKVVPVMGLHSSGEGSSTLGETSSFWPEKPEKDPCDLKSACWWGEGGLFFLHLLCFSLCPRSGHRHCELYVGSTGSYNSERRVIFLSEGQRSGERAYCDPRMWTKSWRWRNECSNSEYKWAQMSDCTCLGQTQRDTAKGLRHEL